VRDFANCSTNTYKILREQLPKERFVPAMDELGAHGLDPAEPPAERRIDLAFHRVRLVAGHLLSPRHLRVAKAPR
jgi:hypothetical protein